MPPIVPACTDGRVLYDIPQPHLSLLHIPSDSTVTASHREVVVPSESTLLLVEMLVSNISTALGNQLRKKAKESIVQQNTGADYDPPCNILHSLQFAVENIIAFLPAEADEKWYLAFTDAQRMGTILHKVSETLWILIELRRDFKFLNRIEVETELNCLSRIVSMVTKVNKAMWFVQHSDDTRTEVDLSMYTPRIIEGVTILTNKCFSRYPYFPTLESNDFHFYNLHENHWHKILAGEYAQIPHVMSFSKFEGMYEMMKVRLTSSGYDLCCHCKHPVLSNGGYVIKEKCDHIICVHCAEHMCIEP